MPQPNWKQLRQSRKLLRSAPRPLVDPEKRLIVLWSPKSACTTTYIWFSQLCGFLDEVKGHSGFPHVHRIGVYIKSERFRETIERDIRDFHVVRIIRDPYSRAVSIFRHALTKGFADDIVARVGMDFRQGVSFGQFLDFAASQNMRSANVHLRPQIHSYERTRKPDTVINISNTDLFERLNALEQAMGWPTTDFKSIQWLHELESSRRADCEHFEGGNVDEIPIVRLRPPRLTRFPEYTQLLTPAAKRRIENIYHDDFEAYRDYF